MFCARQSAGQGPGLSITATRSAMRLPRWFRASPQDRAVDRDARQLYARLVEQARAPAFYRSLGVPDSLDGRFELLALHVVLALRRLKAAGEGTLGQALFDVMFTDLDRTLREIGVSDLSVGKRIKHMARSLFGRIAAYEEGLAQPDDGLLHAALTRNLYGTVPPPAPEILAAVARYMREAAAGFEAVAPAALVASPPPWPAIPVGA